MTLGKIKCEIFGHGDFIDTVWYPHDERGEMVSYRKCARCGYITDKGFAKQ